MRSVITILARSFLPRLTPHPAMFKTQRTQEAPSSAQLHLLRNTLLNLHQQTHLHKGQNRISAQFYHGKTLSQDTQCSEIVPWRGNPAI